MVDWRVFYGGPAGIGEQMPAHKDYSIMYAAKQLMTRSMRPVHKILLDIDNENLRLAWATCLANFVGW